MFVRSSFFLEFDAQGEVGKERTINNKNECSFATLGRMVFFVQTK